MHTTGCLFLSFFVFLVFHSFCGIPFQSCSQSLTSRGKEDTETCEACGKSDDVGVGDEGVGEGAADKERAPEHVVEFVPAAIEIVRLEGALEMTDVLLDAQTEEEKGGLEGHGGELGKDEDLLVDLATETAVFEVDDVLVLVRREREGAICEREAEHEWGKEGDRACSGPVGTNLAAKMMCLMRSRYWYCSCRGGSGGR
jgi:hypothetical protein